MDGTPAVSMTRDGDGLITAVAGVTVTTSKKFLLTGTSVPSGATVSDNFFCNEYGELLTHHRWLQRLLHVRPRRAPS